MILRIDQTVSRTAQRFEVYCGDTLLYIGKLDRISRRQSIYMEDSRGIPVAEGTYVPPKITAFFPLLHWFGIPQTSRQLYCRRNGGEWAAFSLRRCGWLKQQYVLRLAQAQMVCQAYPLCRGRFAYIPIYQDNLQIALGEHYLTTVDNRNRYKLYLLDDFARCSDELAFFTLYYDSWTRTRSASLSGEATAAVSWTLTRYARRYQPDWRQNHFPQENFFGKTSLLQ